MWRDPLLRCLRFVSLHLKLWLLLATLLICLSSARAPAVRHDSPNLHHITRLLSCLRDESFSLQTNLPRLLFPSAWPRPASPLLVALFWLHFLIYLYISDRRTSCASGKISKSAPCTYIMPTESNPCLKYTWMHEYIYCREAPVHPGESHFLPWALLWNGVA